MLSIQGEKVVLTGASSGIGEAIAFELARKGARIILTSGTSLIRALLQNVGILHVVLRENPISVGHEGGKYR